MAVRIEDGINLGALFEETLRLCAMSHKEAAILAGMKPDAWSRAMKGEQPFDLWKLRHLPIRFWHTFLPKLASALIQSWFEEACGERRMVRAELRSAKAEETRKRA